MAVELTDSKEPLRLYAEILKTLIDGGGASIRVMPGQVRISITEEALAPVLKERSIPEEKFRNAVNNDLAVALSAVLAEEERQFIAAGSMTRPGDEAHPPQVDEAKKSELTQLVAFLKEHLMTPQLRGLYYFQQTAKGPVLASTRWEVSVRQQQLEKEDLIPLPYVTVQLGLIHPVHSKDAPKGLLQILGLGHEPKYLTFVCATPDLDALIEELSRAKSALGRV